MKLRKGTLLDVINAGYGTGIGYGYGYGNSTENGLEEL